MIHKFLILVFLIFLSINLNAQYKSGIVVYKAIDVVNKENLNLTSQQRQLAKDIGEIINNLEFNLEFSRRESLFSLKENLALEKDVYLNNMAILFTRGDRKIYSNTEKNLLLVQTKSFGKTFIIKSGLDDITWSLTTETKEIEGYTCYKATANLYNKDQNNKDLKFDLTAWYAKELSFNVGPYESSGLPGLVLEFSNGKLVFVATKIELSKKPLVIEKPSKGKIITKDEFNQIGKKAVEALQD